MIARTLVIAGAVYMATGCLWAPVALAVDAPGASTVNGYQVETNESRFNFNSGDFSMPKKVRFYRPGTDVVGDRAAGNSKRGFVTVSGNVVVHDSGTAPEAGDAAYKGSGPATLTCDELQIDSKQKVYTANGHVHFSQQTRTGSADHGTLNRASGMLHLEGNVRLTDGGSTLVANSVDYNLNTKDAEVHGSPSVLTQPQEQPAPAPVPAASPRTPSPKPRKPH